MDTLSRRKFLIASGVLGGAALADFGATATLRTLADRAKTDPLVAGTGVLVVVTLYGGNDGLNTVIPYADKAYQSNRHDLAYDEGQVIKLSDGLGFNPSLKGLHGLWQQNKVAVVRGTGYPDPDRSHFRSMDIWQTASPETAIRSGWIGRWLDATGDDPLRAVAMGSVLPVLAVGERHVAASLELGPFESLPARTAGVFESLSRTDSTDGASRAFVTSSLRDEQTTSSTFSRLLSKSPAPSDKAGPLEAQLDSMAQAIVAGVPSRVWTASIGGFDTHADERGTQENLLGEVDTAITKFFSTLGNSPRGKGVVMLVHSEFGRRVRANGSDGTDHGTAAPVFVIGNSVKGGFHGEEPSLTRLDPNGDLNATVDFRAVYGEMLSTVLGSDPHRVLSTVPKSLGLIQT